MLSLEDGRSLKKTDNTINVDESVSKTVGSFTYYKGSDGEWYAKLNSKYYKVEPIKWRVLTADYNGTGKKLLLAEKILINCMYYDYTEDRTIGTETIYPNNYEHSRVRAFLNGLSYQKKLNAQAALNANDKFKGKGFLQTAFTAEEIAAIAETCVVNNPRSTNPDGDSNASLWNSGGNTYASDTPTEDKLFLLSEQEVTKDDYGFAAYNASVNNTRIRMATAFAKANGAYQDSTAGYGGYWWLRSPNYGYSYSARYVNYNGSAGYFSSSGVGSETTGVVPALCLN